MVFWNGNLTVLYIHYFYMFPRKRAGTYVTEVGPRRINFKHW